MLETFHTLDASIWHLPNTFYESSEVGLPDRLPNCYDPDNVYVDGEGLHIRAERNVGEYRSGWIDTAGKKSWTHGYFETKIRYPDVPGVWCQMFLVNAGGFPPEIDSGEAFNNDGSVQLCIREAVGVDHKLQVSLGSFLGQWHVFGFLWDECEVVWYFDRREIWRVTSYSPTLPMHLYIILGMGEWQTPNDLLLPATLDVGYVSVWQK
jgi:beta-glucanase (GH16 family)